LILSEITISCWFLSVLYIRHLILLNSYLWYYLSLWRVYDTVLLLYASVYTSNELWFVVWFIYCFCISKYYKRRVPVLRYEEKWCEFFLNQNELCLTEVCLWFWSLHLDQFLCISSVIVHLKYTYLDLRVCAKKQDKSIAQDHQI